MLVLPPSMGRRTTCLARSLITADIKPTMPAPLRELHVVSPQAAAVAAATTSTPPAIRDQHGSDASRLGRRGPRPKTRIAESGQHPRLRPPVVHESGAAMRAARAYLQVSAFSLEGLISQLKYEGSPFGMRLTALAARARPAVRKFDSSQGRQQILHGGVSNS